MHTHAAHKLTHLTDSPNHAANTDVKRWKNKFKTLETFEML